ANVATPATAARVTVPLCARLHCCLPIAPLTFPVKPVAVFPCPSCAVTCTAGVIAAPAAVVLGSTENTSCVAVPAVMLNAALVARSDDRRVGKEPVPPLSMDQWEKGAKHAPA